MLGNHFVVHAEVKYIPSHTLVHHIGQTIDYTRIYGIIQERMKLPTPLLETLVTEMANTILQEFPIAVSAQISVYKQYPPIAHFEGRVGVKYLLERKDVKN